MKILHTSDWHLGRSFHREGLLGHQAVFADHLVEVVVDNKVDVVVVAGDIYDRALPPVDAVELADEILARLATTGARVVITSGNHDSALRLGFGSRLFEAAGVHVRTSLATVGTPILIDDHYGTVAFYPLPYLDPDAAKSAWSLPSRSHAAALGTAMDAVRSDLSQRRGVRSVVMAHAFIAGGHPSESERDISVGGVDRVPTTVFDGVTYGALGHLHGAQSPAEHLRYSGSPLPYSFSESEQLKGSWLVELEADAVTGIEFVPAPVPRRLSSLRGELETLLTDPTLDEYEEDWLQVSLTDRRRPMRAMERLRTRFPGALLLEVEQRHAPDGALISRPRVGKSDHEIALDFLAELRGTPASERESALLQAAAEACCVDPDQDPVQRILGALSSVAQPDPEVVR